MPSQITKTTQEITIRYTEAEVLDHFRSLCPGSTIEVEYDYTEDPYDGYKDKYFAGFKLTKVTEIE